MKSKEGKELGVTSRLSSEMDRHEGKSDGNVMAQKRSERRREVDVRGTRAPVDFPGQAST
jgi:hypothetical protein